jgi:tRNA(Ile)-lysidine synthase
VSELLETVGRTIRTRGLFGPGQGILVAVSGGVDSMVLLHALNGLAARHGWRLTVAHLNHQLRGRSSAADERLVRRTAQKLKLPIVVERADVRQLALAQRLSLEMAARKLRHDFLARAAGRGRIPSIALAHHADDQMELFFLRLLRGSGGEGLAGMKWRNPSPSDAAIELIRPLLDRPKAELIEYAAEQGIRYREDASNAALDFQRNRIRHELLPLLRRKYQPALDKTIPRVMDIVGAEAELAAEVAREWLGDGGSLKSKVQSLKSGEARASLSRLARGQGGGRAGRGRPKSEGRRPKVEGRGSALQRGLLFDELPLAVQRRCVQVQLVALGVVPDYELVEQLRLESDRPVAVGHSGAGVSPVLPGVPPAVETSRARRPGGRRDARPTNRRFRVKDNRGTGETPVLLCAVRDRLGRVDLQPARAEAFKTGTATMDLEGRAGKVDFDGASVWWKICAGRAGQQPKAGPGHECFDADKVGSPVRLRHWRPGDRYQPIGMGSSVKLQDFFTNHKVPQGRRRQLIVAEAANREVFWVEGMRISERFKLTKETIRCLHWRWKRP